MKPKKVYESRLDRVKYTLSSLLGLALLVWFIVAYATWGVMTAPHNPLAVIGWAALGLLLFWLASPSLSYYILNCFHNSQNTSTRANRITTYAALRFLQIIRAPEGWTTALILSDFGQFRIAEGDYQGAEQVFKQAMTCAYKDTRQAEGAGPGVIHCWLGDTYLLQGKTLEAELEFDKALEIFVRNRKDLTPIYEDLATLRLSSIRINHGELAVAEEQLLQTMKSLQTAKADRNHPAFVLPGARLSCDLQLARVYSKSNRWSESALLCAKSMEAIRESDILQYSAPCRHIFDLADDYIANNQPQVIEPLVELLYEYFKETPTHPEALRVLDCFQRLLESTGRTKEVADMRSWLRAPRDGSSTITDSKR